MEARCRRTATARGALAGGSATTGGRAADASGSPSKRPRVVPTAEAGKQAGEQAGVAALAVAAERGPEAAAAAGR